MTDTTPIQSMSGNQYINNEAQSIDNIVVSAHSLAAEILLFNGLSSLLRVQDDDEYKNAKKAIYSVGHVLAAGVVIYTSKKTLYDNDYRVLAVLVGVIAAFFPVLGALIMVLMYKQSKYSMMDISKQPNIPLFNPPTSAWNNLRFQF